MTLLNNFYRIVKQNGRIITVEMNADHEIYKAHFPNNPITPGVCLVQMAVEMYQLIFGGEFSLTEIAKIRYRHVVKPYDHPTFYITPCGLVNGKYKVSVKIEDGEQRFTEMTLYLKSEK